MKKTVYTLLLILLIMNVSFMIVFGDVYHGGGSGTFSINDGDYTSNVIQWTAAFTIPKGNMYIKSIAYSHNQGVTHYYQVSPSATSFTTSKMKVDGTLRTRTVSMKANSGQTYGAFAQKFDTSLTVDLYNGKIYVYSTNNS